jgi:hypothetical protein
MKRLVFIAALIITPFSHDIARADDDPPFQCFVSPEAVLEAHPGSHAVYTAHATWWTESSKCWHVGRPVAKLKSPAIAAVAPARSLSRTQALPLQPQEAQETYEAVTASLRAMMFGSDESPTGFAARFSASETRQSFGAEPLASASSVEVALLNHLLKLARPNGS